MVHEQGKLPVTVQDQAAYLSRFIPIYKAVDFLNNIGNRDAVVYTLNAVQAKFYFKNATIGDWFGPARYHDIFPIIDEPLKLYEFLGRYSVKYLFVDKNDLMRTAGICFNTDLFKIIYEDNQGENQKAVTDIQKLINIDKVKLVIGPDCGSGCTLATAPITEAGQIIQIAPSASNPNVAEAGEYLFSMVALDNYEAEIIATFATDKLKIKKAAIIYPNDEWGVGLKEMFTNNFTERGGKIVLSESFDRSKGDKDFRTIITKIKDKNTDIVYVIGYDELVDLFKQFIELKVNKQILSASMIENIQNIEELKQVGEGIIYTSQLVDIDKEYKQEYKNKYGEEPELFSSINYDIINLLFNAVQKCDENNSCIKDFLYSVKNYKGASGIITINNKGWVERPIQLKTIKSGQFAPYEE